MLGVLFLALITQDVLLPPSTLTWMLVNSWEGNILPTVRAFNVIWSKWQRTALKLKIFL